MLFVLAQHGCRVPLVDDQDAVEEFATGCRRSARRSRWPVVPAPVFG
jgi:hypothetical protein